MNFPKGIKARAIELLNSGEVSASQLAHILGASEATIQSWQREAKDAELLQTFNDWRNLRQDGRKTGDRRQLAPLSAKDAKILAKLLK